MNVTVCVCECRVCVTEYCVYRRLWVALTTSVLLGYTFWEVVVF